MVERRQGLGATGRSFRSPGSAKGQRSLALAREPKSRKMEQFGKSGSNRSDQPRIFLMPVICRDDIWRRLDETNCYELGTRPST